jgi:hypothetical protein
MVEGLTFSFSVWLSEGFPFPFPFIIIAILVLTFLYFLHGLTLIRRTATRLLEAKWGLPPALQNSVPIALT